MDGAIVILCLCIITIFSIIYVSYRHCKKSQDDNRNILV